MSCKNVFFHLLTGTFFIVIPMLSHAEFSSFKEILNRNQCFSCHHATATSIGPFLSYDSYEDWVLRGYIIPKNSSTSTLIKKMRNSPGGNMPLPLSSDQMSDIDFNQLKGFIDALDPKKFRSADFINIDTKDREMIVDIGFDPHREKAQKIIFKKCYEKFMNRPLFEDNSTYLKIKNKEIGGVDACMELLDLASLENDEIDSNNKEGQLILQSLFDFHRSWFPNKESELSIEGHDYMNDYYDPHNAAYYLTRSLFTSLDYQYVVKSEIPIKGIRYDENRQKVYNDIFASYGDGRTFHDSVGVLAPAEIGTLWGIEEKSDSLVKTDISLAKSFFSKEFAIFPTAKMPSSVHFGSGLIGDAGFLMLNSGGYLNRPIDGGSKIPRTFSQSLFDSLLCRSLPVLRAEDVSNDFFVHPSKSSPLAFRNNISCMKCHATMDSMGNSLRNFQATKSHGKLIYEDEALAEGVLAVIVVEKEVTLPSESLLSWPDEVDNFDIRPPIGRLYFRSFTGEKVDKEVVGLRGSHGLGAVLATTDDLYACAAKRYFYFLTGINVNLEELKANSAPKFSKKELDYRLQVMRLGEALRKDQSLKLLIKRIISSRAFLVPGLGVE